MCIFSNSFQLLLVWTWPEHLCSQDPIYKKSALVHVMALCHQASIHYLDQSWQIFVRPFGINRDQWVNENRGDSGQCIDNCITVMLLSCLWIWQWLHFQLMDIAHPVNNSACICYFMKNPYTCICLKKSSYYHYYEWIFKTFSQFFLGPPKANAYCHGQCCLFLCTTVNLSLSTWTFCGILPYFDSSPALNDIDALQPTICW